MKLGSFLKSKKYLLQIYFAITLAAVVTVTVVIWGIFYAIKGTILNAEHKTSLEMLMQIQNSTAFFQKTSETICHSVFRNSDVQSLLFQRNAEEEDLMQYANRITDTYLSANPSIKSIYIYNAYQDTYYSTWNGIHNVDENFKQLVAQNSFSQNLVPVIRFDGTEVLATFVLSENYGAAMKSGSAIYVNMRYDWLFNYMESVNRITDVESNSLFIFDAQNTCINGLLDSDSVRFSAAIQSKLDEKADASDMRVFDVDINGVRYGATMLQIRSYDWKVVRIYPYDTLFQELSHIRLLLFIFNLLSFAAIMLLFTALAKKLYQPVNRLMKHFDVDSDENIGITEFEFLEQSFQLSKEELIRLERENSSQHQLMKEYALKVLFTEAKPAGAHAPETLMSEYQFAVSLNEPLSLLLLKIDDYSALRKEYDGKQDQAIVMFGIHNVLNEIISEKFACELVGTAEQHIAVLYSAAHSTDFAVALVKKAESFVKQHFSLSFCMATEENISAEQLFAVHEILQNALNDRFMLGSNCLITKEVRTRTVNKIYESYNFEEETPFLESLTHLKFDAATKQLDKLMAQIRTLDFKSACLAAEHFTNSIQKAVFEINKFRKEPVVTGSYQARWEQIPEHTLTQCHACVQDFIDYLQSSYQHGSSKHQVLAEAIRDYIDKMYDNYDLGAATISEMLKISSAHAGRVFNTYMNLSIPEYINEVRMQKAMEWMQNSDFTVQEIAVKVGYLNESYFYKIFKEKYNATPRNYIKAIQKNKNA